MDENNITNETTNQNTETISTETTPVEKENLAESTPAENISSSTSDSSKDAAGKIEDDTSPKTAVFESQPVSDTYEKANTAATTPVKSAFEMNNSSPSASNPSVNYYSAPASTSAVNSTSVASSTSAVNSTSTTTANPSSAGYNSDFYTGSPFQEPAETSKGFGIASLVLSIISLLTCCCGLGSLFAILGIIFGCIQEKDAYGKKPGQAVAGIIISIISLILSILCIIYFVAVGAMSELM